MQKLEDHYQKEVVATLMKELGLKNKLAVPRLKKVNINVGIGTYLAGTKDYAPVVKNITDISGQKPVVTKATKAISNFKLRAGMPVGVGVTLRKHRMYDFVSKLINIVLPRMRDFRGLNVRSFDGRGNYSIGIKEFSVFPEIQPDDIVKNHGIQITVVTSAHTDKEGYLLLKELGFPLKKEEVAGITS